MGSPFGGQKAGKVPKPSAEERTLQKAIVPLVLSILYEKPEDALRAPEGWTQEEWEAYLKETGIPIDLIKSGNILTKFKETINEIEKTISGMSEREKEELAPIIEDYERYKKSLEPGLKSVPLSLGGRYIGSAFPARRADFLRLLLKQEAETIAQPYNRLLQEAQERERLAGARLGLFEYPYGLYKSMFTARYGVPPVQTTGWLTSLLSAAGTAAGTAIGKRV